MSKVRFQKVCCLYRFPSIACNIMVENNLTVLEDWQFIAIIQCELYTLFISEWIQSYFWFVWISVAYRMRRAQSVLTRPSGAHAVYLQFSFDISFFPSWFISILRPIWLIIFAVFLINATPNLQVYQTHRHESLHLLHFVCIKQSDFNFFLEIIITNPQ